MGTIEKGYGIRLDTNFQPKNDAATLLVDRIINAKDSAILADYKEYCKDNSLDENDVEAKESFVDDYENEQTCGSGLEQLAVDFINEEKFDNEQVFVYEDCTICVLAYIPKEKNTILPSQEDIRRIIADYINPLIKEPVDIEWLQIHF